MIEPRAGDTTYGMMSHRICARQHKFHKEECATRMLIGYSDPRLSLVGMTHQYDSSRMTHPVLGTLTPVMGRGGFVCTPSVFSS